MSLVPNLFGSLPGATLFLSVFLLVPPAHAISLSEARMEALENYLGFKVAEEQVSAARSEREARRADLFPKLSFDGNFSYRSDESEIRLGAGAIGPGLPAKDVFIPLLDRDRYEMDLTLTQTIFSGGKFYLGLNRAKAIERATEWGEQQAIEKMLLSLEEAYYGLFRAEEEEIVGRQKLTDLRAHLSNVEKLYAAGRIPLTDVLKVKVEVSRADEGVLKAVNEREIAKGNLNRLLGRSGDLPIEVGPVQDPSPIKLEMKGAQEIAVNRRPALLRLREQQNAALLSRRVAEGEYYPKMDLSSRYTVQGGQETISREQWEILGTVHWTFWEWGKIVNEVAEARAVERQGIYQGDLLAEQIRQEVREAWLRIREADGRMKVAREAVTHAEENVRVTMLGFQAGVNTSTDLLDAETLLAETRFEMNEARYDAWVARAGLRFAMGIIREEHLPEWIGSSVQSPD